MTDLVMQGIWLHLEDMPAQALHSFRGNPTLELYLELVELSSCVLRHGT